MRDFDLGPGNKSGSWERLLREGIERKMVRVADRKERCEIRSVSKSGPSHSGV